MRPSKTIREAATSLNERPGERQTRALAEIALAQFQELTHWLPFKSGEFQTVFFRGVTAGLAGDIGEMLRAHKAMAEAIEASRDGAIVGSGVSEGLSVDSACDMLIDMSEVLRRLPITSVEQLCLKAEYMRLALPTCPEELQHLLVVSLLEDIDRILAKGPTAGAVDAKGEDALER